MLVDVPDVPIIDGLLGVTGLSFVVAIAERTPNDGAVILLEEGFGITVAGGAVDVIAGAGLSLVVDTGDILGVTPNEKLLVVGVMPNDKFGVAAVTPNDTVVVGGLTPNDRFVVTGAVILLGFSFVVDTGSTVGFVPNEKFVIAELVPNDGFVGIGAVILV